MVVSEMTYQVCQLIKPCDPNFVSVLASMEIHAKVALELAQSSESSSEPLSAATQAAHYGRLLLKQEKE